MGPSPRSYRWTWLRDEHVIFPSGACRQSCTSQSFSDRSGRRRTCYLKQWVVTSLQWSPRTYHGPWLGSPTFPSSDFSSQPFFFRVCLSSSSPPLDQWNRHHHLPPLPDVNGGIENSCRTHHATGQSVHPSTSARPRSSCRGWPLPWPYLRKSRQPSFT